MDLTQLNRRNLLQLLSHSQRNSVNWKVTSDIYYTLLDNTGHPFELAIPLSNFYANEFNPLTDLTEPILEENNQIIPINLNIDPISLVNSMNFPAPVDELILPVKLWQVSNKTWTGELDLPEGTDIQVPPSLLDMIIDKIAPYTNYFLYTEYDDLLHKNQYIMGYPFNIYQF